LMIIIIYWMAIRWITIVILKLAVRWSQRKVARRMLFRDTGSCDKAFARIQRPKLLTSNCCNC
jgi:hypothetical protein